jgi:hypothetical protein
LDAREVVGCGGVDDDVVFGYLGGYEVGVVEVADDGVGAGLGEGVGVRLAADEGGYGVVFCDEKVEDGPADEAGADEEDIFGGGHCWMLIGVWFVVGEELSVRLLQVQGFPEDD